MKLEAQRRSIPGGKGGCDQPMTENMPQYATRIIPFLPHSIYHNSTSNGLAARFRHPGCHGDRNVRFFVPQGKDDAMVFQLHQFSEVIF